ncbi:MAG: BRCT domain-containing protein [Benjaminiella poitrasii]|nr:MAG: BRCT domain-containing protein [Benjaminiella poitrasii]KAI9470718.1 MAG: BRCT domain-containing protein [Benjaminiella poitrasii]
MLKPKVKYGRSINSKCTVQLFNNVNYIIDDSLPNDQKQQLKDMLDNNGGTAGDFKRNVPNLYISKSTRYPFKHAIKIVTLPENRKDAIYKQLCHFGGQYRNELTKDVTCLVCAYPNGVYYDECIKNNIPVVLNRWLDDCFRLERKVDCKPYCFPSPSMFYSHNPKPALLFPYPKTSDALVSFLSQRLRKGELIFQDQVIYFGRDVIADQRKLCLLPIVTKYIQNLGGRISKDYNSNSVTIVILKYRSSNEYKQAIKDDKCIASFWWLSNTLARGYICSPLTVLLDYPVPKLGIPGMRDCVIAVTGYKGVSRSFLNALIIATGAKLSLELQEDTTHLICGCDSGSKYLEVNKYPKVILVNHVWLEDCYTNWKKIHHKSERRYTYIPRNNKSLSNIVGRTHLIPQVLDKWRNEVLHGEPKIIYQEYAVNETSKPRRTALRVTSVLNNFIASDA